MGKIFAIIAKRCFCLTNKPPYRGKLTGIKEKNVFWAIIEPKFYVWKVLKLKSIERVGIVLRPSTPELKDMFYHVKATFDAHGIEVMIDNISGAMIGVLGQEFDILCRSCDILVTVGGDGTLISARDPKQARAMVDAVMVAMTGG